MTGAAIDIAAGLADRGPEFGWRACREWFVRLGEFAPITAEEERWAAEGPVDPHDMDCVRGGA